MDVGCYLAWAVFPHGLLLRPLISFYDVTLSRSRLRAGLDEGRDIAVAALADIGAAAMADLNASRDVAIAVLGQDGRVVGAKLADAGDVAVAVLPRLAATRVTVRVLNTLRVILISICETAHTFRHHALATMINFRIFKLNLFGIARSVVVQSLPILTSLAMARTIWLVELRRSRAGRVRKPDQNLPERWLQPDCWPSIWSP
ncbi:hypothetical protein ATY29_08830 [Rhizobium hidalgonense]|nr:hypothetical protein ATY29_08830 [Rhizobium hidalgonense]